MRFDVDLSNDVKDKNGLAAWGDSPERQAVFLFRNL